MGVALRPSPLLAGTRSDRGVHKAFFKTGAVCGVRDRFGWGDTAFLTGGVAFLLLRQVSMSSFPSGPLGLLLRDGIAGGTFRLILGGINGSTSSVGLEGAL